MFKLSIFLVFLSIQLINLSQAKEEILVFTVASDETDGYKRYIRSANHYGIKVITLGMDKEWEGGDMNSYGGGYKVNLLKKAVAELDDQHKDAIILFTDSYDVIFTSSLDDILQKFKSFDADVVFGAERLLWPKQSLEKLYPPVLLNAAKYLNSGLFIGYRKQIEGILNDSPIKNTDDDQLYYSEIFVDESKRKAYGMKLDSKSELFLNLNGAKKDIKLNINANTGSGEIENIHFKTFPSIVHGNGPSKYTLLNSLGNYLAGTFDQTCKICKEDNIELDENNLPSISLTVSILKPYPFLREFWNKINALNYPKKNINLFVHVHVPTYPASDELSKKFIEQHEKEYNSVRFISTQDELQHGKQIAVDQAIEKNSEYIFFVDGDLHLDNPEVLRELLKYNRGFIAPLLSKYNSLWSNFWGDISSTGFYARSNDYLDIVNHKIVGMWNVPYISSGYLVKREVFSKLNFYYNTQLDPDMSLCEKLRYEGVFMYIVNEDNYGHIVDDSEFDTTRTNPDFYSLPTNQLDWEKRYLHPEYHLQLNESYKQMQPCPDVFWLKMVTEEFCDDLVDIMESFGQWSSGSNEDERIQGGYENVPTRDIHFRQVGLNGMWNKFMNTYIKPLSELIFTGYSAGTHHADLQFVVRYKPDEQPYLRPHHDASTYTINVALNTAGVDYEGGGCKFTRYNCSVTDTKKGWMLMHPGRLTHQHEGLYTTKGTRYILVTFINP